MMVGARYGEVWDVATPLVPGEREGVMGPEGSDG